MGNEPVAEIERMIALEYESPDPGPQFPVKAFNNRLGQTLCEACDHGVDMGEMIFLPMSQDDFGYGYYHPECVLADPQLLEAFNKKVGQ